MTIDMHAHWSPPELIDMYRARAKPPQIVVNDDGVEVLKTRRGEQAFDDMFDDLDTRLAEMDEHGISTGVLSLWGPTDRSLESWKSDFVTTQSGAGPHLSDILRASMSTRRPERLAWDAVGAVPRLLGNGE